MGSTKLKERVNQKLILSGSRRCLQQDMVESSAVYQMRCPRRCRYRSSRVWGTGVYKSESSVCFAALHAGKLDAEKGGTVTVYKVKPVPFQDPFYIGSQSQYGWYESEQDGFFQSSFVFDLLHIDCSANGTGMENSFNRYCPPGCNNEDYQVSGDGIYTEDSSICAAAIHNGQISAERGGPVSGYKLPGMTSYTGSTKNGIETNYSGDGDRSFTFEIPCGLTAEKFKVNNTYTIVCPISRPCWRDLDKTAVYGIYVFSERSNLCLSARHDRAIPYLYEGGVAHVRVGKGMLSYRGVYYGQIASQSSGPTEKSFIFETGRDRSAKKESCTLQGSDFKESIFSVFCYIYCNVATDSVWGYQNYTDSSYICAAALQDNRLGGYEYGRVHVEIIPGQKSYRAYYNNGVVSHEHGPWHRSFRFTNI